MADVVAWAAIIISVLALVLVYIIPPPWVKRMAAPLSGLVEHVSDPHYLGAAIGHAITQGHKGEDGKEPRPSDVMFAWMMALEPQVMQHVKEMAPSLIPLALGQEAPNPGRMLAQQRWGMRGAQAAGKVVQKAGGLGGIGELIQLAPDIMQLMSMMKGTGPPAAMGQRPAAGGAPAQPMQGGSPW